MQQHYRFIVQFLSERPNHNMAETRLCQQYSMHFSRSTFDDALRALIEAGMVERVPPMHVRLK